MIIFILMIIFSDVEKLLCLVAEILAFNCDIYQLKILPNPNPPFLRLLLISFLRLSVVFRDILIPKVILIIWVITKLNLSYIDRYFEGFDKVSVFVQRFRYDGKDT